MTLWLLEWGAEESSLSGEHLFGRGTAEEVSARLTRPGYLSRQAKKSYYLAALERHGGAKLAGRA